MMPSYHNYQFLVNKNDHNDVKVSLGYCLIKDVDQGYSIVSSEGREWTLHLSNKEDYQWLTSDKPYLATSK